MKILVADDSRVMRQIVIRTLRQAGYDDHDIVEAEDGRRRWTRSSRRSRTWCCRTGTCRT